MLHWFNPLVWLAYTLMEKDMEMSCDEAVISGSGDNIKQAYFQSLLNISIDGNTPFMPLSFAEGNTKNRIKNILSFKKLPFPEAIAITVIVITVSILCAFRPIPNPEPLRDNIKLSVNAEPTLIVSHNQTNDIVKITDSSLNNWIDSLNIREINSYLHIECEYKCHFALYTPQRNYYLYNGPQGYSDYPEYLLQVQTKNNCEIYSISEEDFNGMYACYHSAKKKPVKYKHYSYKGDDPLLQLAYTAEMSSLPDEGIKTSAIVIHDYSIEENKLKIFATVFNRNYKICDNKVITSN